MDTPESSPPFPLIVKPTRQRRPYFLMAITMAALIMLGWGCFGFWQRYTTPEPPVVDLAGVDDEIVDAVRASVKQVKLAPRVPENWGSLGAVFRAHEFLEPANACFREAERLAPSDPRWPYLIGLGFIQTSPADAIPNLRRAVSLCGDRAAPRLQLAEVLLDRSEVTEAESLFQFILVNQQAGQKAEERTLDEARAHLGLGKSALARHNEEAALEHLTQAAAKAPRAKTIRAILAQAYRRNGNELAAVEELRRETQLPEGWSWPDPWAAAINSAWVGMRARMHRINQLDQQGFREEAVVLARQALQRHSDSPLAYLVLGEMLNKSRNFAASLPILEEATRRDPQRSKAHFELGYSLQMQGKGTLAAESYRKSIQLEPGFPEAHFNLALCLNSLQDSSEALEEFRSAIRLRPNYVDARLGLCMLLTQESKYEEAEEQLNEVARLAPADGRWKELKKEIDSHRTK